MKKEPLNIAVIGGGASGFFAAIRAAELARTKNAPATVHVYDSAPAFLTKVRISGGGRCNVTHNQFDPALFCQSYPRGKKELRSPFTQFQAKDTVEWFKKKGVNLVAEEDGRMFPSTNSSETVIKCFIEAAEKNGVKLFSRSPVQKITKEADGKFYLEIKSQKPFKADKVLIATGSAKAGRELARSLGHDITELAPSLFSFKIQHPLLKALPGTSFPQATVNLKLPDGKKFVQQGALLITHRGLSGPAILKLSAWAAREMKRANYQASLQVNWTGAERAQDILARLESAKAQGPKALVKNASMPVTKRFWLELLQFLEVDMEKKWADLSKKDMNKIFEGLFSLPLTVQGQNRFKEEFVECGGVKLSQVNFKTMESKICPCLHFSGEVLDIDGITGGFNFQNAWTTGFIAATHMIIGS